MSAFSLLSSTWSLFREVYPPAPKWSVNDIPDMSGKVVVVTGGYAGLGKETVKELLKRNARVYIAGRSETKARQAIDELKAVTGGKEALFLYLDLANLNSVRNAVKIFQSLETQLHVLFNNGGVMKPGISETTDDGYDLQFGTNVIGHYLFTNLLLPTLISTARLASGDKVRIINLASIAEIFVNKIDYASLKDGPERRNKNIMALYGQSKAANILFSHELAKRYGNDGIVSIALHPGVIDTELQRRTYSWQRWFWKYIFYGPGYGALTQLYAGTAPEAESLNGKYLVPWARIGQPFGRVARNPVAGEKLWEWLAEQTKVF